MFPFEPADNTTYCTNMDFIFGGHFYARRPRFVWIISYLSNFIGIKFAGNFRPCVNAQRAPHLLRAPFELSILFNHVTHIIQGCAQKEVIRIYANPIITFVQYLKALIKVWVIEIIRNSVREKLLASDAHRAISIRLDVTKPFPTFRFLVLRNLSPKFGYSVFRYVGYGNMWYRHISLLLRLIRLGAGLVNSLRSNHHISYNYRHQFVF